MSDEGNGEGNGEGNIRLSTKHPFRSGNEGAEESAVKLIADKLVSQNLLTKAAAIKFASEIPGNLRSMKYSVVFVQQGWLSQQDDELRAARIQIAKLEKFIKPSDD